MTYKPSKLGQRQTDLVSLVCGHILSAGLRMQVFTCSGYDFGDPG